MKHLFTLFILLFLGCIAVAQSMEGIDACQTTKVRYFGKLFNDAQAREASVANYQSGLAYPGDSGINITYYGLDLRLTHTPAYLNGAATITLKANSANLNRFFLGRPTPAQNRFSAQCRSQTDVCSRDKSGTANAPQPLSWGRY